MQVRSEPDAEVGNATLVTVAGLVDAVGATELWDATSPQIVAARPSVLVDMSGVDVLTSAGITTLIRFLNHARPLGGKLALFGCKPAVRKVFRIVGMESLLGVVDTIEEARAKAR
jgi:anti-anti-sigma factor